jgi:hypothetical protein
MCNKEEHFNGAIDGDLVHDIQGHDDFMHGDLVCAK